MTSRYIFNAIFHISKKVFRKDSLAMIPVFILFLPGTIIHELAHFITAELLLVKAYDLEVAPRLSHGYLQMGSVQVAKSDVFRRMLIGVAPVFVGILVLFSALSVFTSYVGFSNIFASPTNMAITGLVLWLCFFVPNTMFSSRKDMEGAVELLLALVFLGAVAGLVLFFLKINPLPSVLGLLSNSWLTERVGQVCLLLSIPVASNLIIFLLSRLLLKRML